MEITLRNKLPASGTPLNGGTTINMIGRSSAQDVNVNTSHQVGLHAQLVSYDITKDNGVNVGLNPPVAVGPGQTATFHWYAGTEFNPSTSAPGATPVEFGAISLSPSDPLMQHPYGLVGGLIVEPAGSTWKEDSNSRASAVVTKADATKFREFVAVFQDDLASLQSGGSSAVNYRTEPLVYRFSNPNWLDNTKAQAQKGGIVKALTDALVAGDPQTPVFATAKDIPVRMRMLHPAGLAEEVVTLHGQVWQEEPYTSDSTAIGDNQLSQASGSRDTFGANASFDMVLNSGGAGFRHPGDYLYRTFIGNDFLDGMWGLVRVGEAGQDIVKIIIAVANNKNVLVSGVNTVNTDTGAMAKTVAMFAGEGSGGTKIGDAPVDPMKGTWQLSVSVASVPDKVTVVSSEGGSYVATMSKKPAPVPKGVLTLSPQYKNKTRDAAPGARGVPTPVTTDFRPKPITQK